MSLLLLFNGKTIKALASTTLKAPPRPITLKMGAKHGG